MRRKARIWICLPRREWTNAIRAVRVELAVKIPDIRSECFHSPILRRNNDYRPSKRTPQSRHKECARTPRQTGYDDVAFSAQRFRRNTTEIGNIRDPAEDLVNSFFERFHSISAETRTVPARV